MSGWQFPDVELWACTTLREALAVEGVTDVPVGIRVPTERPQRFVVLNADPGPARLIDAQINLRVRVWAGSEQEAADLALTVRRLLTVAATGRDGINVIPGGSLPAWVPDPTGQPMRVQWVPLLVRAHDKE